MRGGWLILSALFFLTPASTLAQQCSQYSSWSVAQADQLTRQAHDLTLTVPDCLDANWHVCKQIDDLIYEVETHLSQVFRGEAAGPGDPYRCINCQMDDLLRMADIVRAYGEWLDQRYYKYRGAYGNLLETFQGYSGLPLCATSGPPPPPPPPSLGSTALCPNLPGSPLEPQPSLYMETGGGAVWDRGFVNFYFNIQENLYCGYPAAGGSADFTGQYLTQEGNGFVLHVLVGGALERKVFYNRLETYTDDQGKVWDNGTRVDAATNQPIGDWKAHWNR
jgi:hypothetical protein